MKSSIDRLIETASDAELCGAVADTLFDKYGNEIDAKKYTKEARVVILALTASGIIGNGGFRYLFEGYFRGDPSFRLTAQAFESLGVKPAVTAFKKALAVFPNSQPPKDSLIKRLDIFLSVPPSRREKIDKLFWSADEQITAKLAQYIRDQREAFNDLKVRAKTKRKVR